jgi:aspartate dehydrogenase
MSTILLVGFGAMGRFVYDNLKAHPLVTRWIVLEREAHKASVQALLLTRDRFVSSIHGLAEKPDFAVECAGHGVVRDVVPVLLDGGISTVIASVGALADSDVLTRLEAACTRGGSQLTLVPGALAGVDALAASRMFGLDSVRYSGRKPPRGWKGTRAEQLCDLDSLTEAAIFFRGSARQAASSFPRNANVAAMVGLAGLGLDNTEVELIADPAATGNTHTISALGGFGSMDICISAKAFATNPGTSVLAGMSVIRTVQNRLNQVVI